MVTSIVTPKQLEILILLYRFRFLNRSQLQTLLNHKEPRRIKTWLKDLTDKKIIGRHYSTKFNENTKPAIYYLITKSKTLLIERPEVDPNALKRVYREHMRSQRLIEHCIRLAKFYLQLKEQTKGKTLHFFTKTDLTTHDYFPYSHPDAYIAIKDGKKMKRYFFEIIDEGAPRFILRSKIKMYIEYFSENTWTTNTGHPFPKILLLCPNNQIKDYLHKHISLAMEEEVEVEIDFFLSNTDKVEWVNALAEEE